MDVLIIGGGIGGLTTALCLHQAGFTVRVCESADQLKPLGVGINLLPHCVRVRLPNEVLIHVFQVL